MLSPLGMSRGRIDVLDHLDLLGRDLISFGGDPGAFRGEHVLVTGAAGTIGGALVRSFQKFDISVCGVDRIPSEEVDVVGDLCDPDVLTTVLQGCGVIFHAAALKHVDRAEFDPDLTWKINRDLVGSICNHRPQGSRLLFVSTDKAAFPAGVMGKSKREAERLVLADSAQGPAFVVRFPNILGSSDSVLPIWSDQLSKGGALTLTDPTATRWFLTESEAVDLLLAVCSSGTPGAIHVPRLGDPIVIGDLLNRFLVGHHCPDHPVEIIDLRSGEKKHEVLFEHPPGASCKVLGVGLDQK